MFNRNKEKSVLEVAHDRAIANLETLQLGSKEYEAQLKTVESLHTLMFKDRMSRRVSPDTMVLVAANIFGILWITRYERENVVTSKALGFIQRTR
jgi:hypothetical protein